MGCLSVISLFCKLKRKEILINRTVIFVLNLRFPNLYEYKLDWSQWTSGYLFIDSDQYLALNIINKNIRTKQDYTPLISPQDDSNLL